MEPTTNSVPEGKAEPSIRVQEKNGHLQVCILYVLSIIGKGCRGPQGLGNHSSETQDITIKYPRALIGNVDDERTTV